MISTSDNNSMVSRDTVKAICRYVAGEYRRNGIDPKMVPATEAWRWYVGRCEGDLRASGQWHSTPQKYKDFLSIDSEGGKMFQEEWAAMDREALIEGRDLWLPQAYR